VEGTSVSKEAIVFGNCHECLCNRCSKQYKCEHTHCLDCEEGMYVETCEFFVENTD